PATQADPAATGPVKFTVAFNQPVAGFDASDVSLVGSTAGGTLVAAVSGGSLVYTIMVSGMTSTGDVVINVPAGAAVSANGPTPAAAVVDNRVHFDNGVSPPSPPVSPPPPVVRTFAAGAGTGSGAVRYFNADQSERYALTPFGPTFAGGVRTAAADFDG